MIAKNKIEDIEKEESELKYKKINCNCDTDIDCIRCQYDKREESLKDYTKKRNENDQQEMDIENNGKKIVKFKKIKVIRGKHDDVIGWQEIWQ